MRLARNSVLRETFKLDSKFIQRMGKRFKWVEPRPDQFVAAFAQEFGEYRRPEKERKIFSSADLRSVTQVIEMIICLRF